MDTGRHELADLFEALGLDCSRDAIERFVAHHTLLPGEPIAEARFWTTAQAEFLEAAIAEDAEWAEAVDHLATLLLSKP